MSKFFKRLFSLRDVDWGFSCGRHFLKIDGFVVAVEGETCRDHELRGAYGSNVWTDRMIVDMAEKRVT